MDFEDTNKELVKSFCSWLLDNGYVYEIKFVSDTVFRVVFEKGKK